MFRTIHALALIAGLFVFAGQSVAQDPVTQRPGMTQPKSAPAAKEAAKAAPKLLLTLEGREEGLYSGPLTFHLYEGNQAVMVDGSKTPVTGSFKADGDRLQVTFANCVYEGTAAPNGILAGGGRMTSGPNAGKTWSFSLAARLSIAGRTFAGKETLPGYGDITFRFVDGKTAEMIDRDGVTRGNYSLNGAQLSMTFGTAMYTGEVRGDAIVGSARNHNTNWTFAINSSK